MKKVIYITGTRADFNLMITPLLELKKYVNLIIIATGMHFLDKFGSTIQEIEKYDFTIKNANINLKCNNLKDMLKSFGLEILELTKIINDINPDLVFVEGDRGEALAGAIIGAHLNIPVIHHGGGDISDSIDDKIRNAITMFSDYHLTGNGESFNRLHNMGISKKKLFNVGEPGLDNILSNNYTQKDIIIEKYGIIPEKPLLLLIFHPNTKEITTIEKQIIEILEAIRHLEVPTIGLYANADAGGMIINRCLDTYQAQLPFLKLQAHFFQEDFLGLMNVCSVMVGNSSSGITELPSFKKPFICVGTRQKGRLRTDNVIDVSANKEEIIRAIEKGLNDEAFKNKLLDLKNPYGDGDSYLKITQIIRNILENNS